MRRAAKRARGIERKDEGDLYLSAHGGPTYICIDHTTLLGSEEQRRSIQTSVRSERVTKDHAGQLVRHEQLADAQVMTKFQDNNKYLL